MVRATHATPRAASQLIVALYVLDCGTDWNLYVSIRSYTRDSEAFFGEQFAQGHDGDLGCTCTCGDDGFCEETATSGTTAASVCVGLANYFSSRGSEPKYCDVPHLMQESANPGATPCGTQYDVAATRSDLRFLEAISVGQALWRWRPRGRCHLLSAGQPVRVQAPPSPMCRR